MKSLRNHPNRSRTVRLDDDPTPAQIRAAREAAGLTQTEAGSLCHRSLRAWQQAEAGTRNLDPAAWDLFLLRTNQHPDYLLVIRKNLSPRLAEYCKPSNGGLYYWVPDMDETLDNGDTVIDPQC